MLKKEFMDYLDTLDYETQKEKLRLLKDDNQAFDDCCNALELLVDAVIDCIKVIGKMFK